MRKLFFVALLILAVPVALAQAAGSSGLSDRERQDIKGVIESQLAAFQRDDGTEAFSYASPTIQRKFQTAEIFMTMVRSGYTAVYRPQQIEFRDLRMIDGVPAQEILFVGPDNEVVSAIYVMQQQPDGSWKINGVYFLPTPEAAT